MKTKRVGAIGVIRAALRNTGAKPKLLSTTVEASTEPEGDQNFRVPLSKDEADILKGFMSYRVFVDTYPSDAGNQDVQIPVNLDLDVHLDQNPSCEQQLALFALQVSTNDYGARRLAAIDHDLRDPAIKNSVTAQVSTDAQHTESRAVTFGPAPKPFVVGPPVFPTNRSGLVICMKSDPAPPPGQYDLTVNFTAQAAAPELRQGGFTLEGQIGPVIADPTTAERNKEDFLDLGLTLTSSVDDVEQLDKTIKRVRTTRGVTDLFFSPLLNYRTVGTIGTNGGWVQVLTPYIDAKVSTGKITKDTLSLNRINLGLDYEFRDYLNTHRYPDLLRFVPGFKHTSDRDFKQDEAKFTFEFEPILGALNQPLGSAPNLLNEEVVADKDDRFGFEIVPVVGLELGRTYRVRDPKEFEGISRNVRRFYFGGDMVFDLTKYLHLSLGDRFYIRGERLRNREKNYFIGSVEAPLGRIGNTRAAHALFFSFERGAQPPFDKPDINAVKFGYRVRARGLLF